MFHKPFADLALAKDLIAGGHVRLMDELIVTTDSSNQVAYYNSGWKLDPPLPLETKAILNDRWDFALRPSPCSQIAACWLLQNPESVAGKTVVDLAAGSGIVGIAAAKAGAAQVTTIDYEGEEWIRLNAEANNVSSKIDCVVDSLFSTKGREAIQKADVLTLCAFFGNGERHIQTLMLDQVKERNATLIVCATPDADFGWNLLESHGVPVRPRNTRFDFFDEKQPFPIVLFEVTRESLTL